MSYQQNEGNWKKSKAYYVSASYIQPLLLWAGAMLVCRYGTWNLPFLNLNFIKIFQSISWSFFLVIFRALDPVALPSEASQAVKLRLLNFVRSLSTVLAFAYCLSRWIFAGYHMNSHHWLTIVPSTYGKHLFLVRYNSIFPPLEVYFLFSCLDHLLQPDSANTEVLHGDKCHWWY